MDVVLLGLVVGLVLVVLIVLFVAGSASSASRRSAEKQVEADREVQRLKDEAELLLAPGEPLVCLGCNHRFAGPMPELGCPGCRLTSFVVAERTLTKDAPNVSEENIHP